MNTPLNTFDWSLIQAFLAVAEEGSLSAAARVLNASQPTLGRQIRTMETALGATLFVRKARGLALTETGEALLAPAEAMRRAMGEITLAAAGRESQLQGTVRITASENVSQSILPPILADIRQKAPEIALELVPTDETENLLFREADIAIRMYRPEQLDVVTRYLGELALGLYAASAYLDRAGRPVTMEDALAMDVVGYDQNDRLIAGFREFGINVTRDFFKIRCDNPIVQAELVAAGCGLGFMQKATADRDPRVEQLLPQMPIPTLPVWLTAHEVMRKTPRIRRVWDLLVEGLSAVVS